MGEYFDWINIDRKEYICPADFDYGNKLYESMTRDNEFLNALKDLLTKEWKGCRIAWIGDECLIPKIATMAEDFFSILQKQYEEIGFNGSIIDMVIESYSNVSGLYKDAEEYVREEIGHYLADLNEMGDCIVNEYGIDPKDPYKGLFYRSGAIYKYTINYTKRVCYSLEQTRILNKVGVELDGVDPLPYLLGYGRTYHAGEWLGDIIGVSDEIDDSIQVLDSISIDW